MKCKTAKTVLFSILAALFLLRCEDAKNLWHPGDPVIPDGKSYTVSFNANSGSGAAPASITAKSGESIRLPNAEDLSRTNYTFGGWNTSASGTGTNFAAGSSFTVPTQNFTLYAKWEKNSEDGNTPNAPNNPSSNEPGSLPSNAIELPTSNDYDGNIAGAIPQNLDAVWYKFTRYGPGTLEAADRKYTTNFTSDIVIDLYDSNLSLVNLYHGPIYELDLGELVGSTHEVSFSNWSGTYYVKVKPKGGSASNKGTFRLYFFRDAM